MGVECGCGADGVSELTVYHVGGDLGYRSLLYDLSGEEFDRVPQFDGTPLRETWPTPPVYVDNYLAPSPDVWHLASAFALAVTSPVVERLEPFLSLAGELLPLENHTGEEWEFLVMNILNVLDVHECIDISYSAEDRIRLLEEQDRRMIEAGHPELVGGVRDRDDPYPLLYPAFVADALGEPTLFRVSRLAAAIFCLERDDREDSFQRRVERLGITGLLFDRVWSSVTGPEPVNLFRL